MSNHGHSPFRADGDTPCQALRYAAAVKIQTVQRRKAAQENVERRRRIKALQRRKSATLAAVSIQRVARGRSARAEAARTAADTAARRKARNST